MLKKFHFLIIFVLTLLSSRENGESAEVQYPPETIIVKTAIEKNDWREIARNVTKKRTLVEFIPCKQKESKWKKKISIEYMHKTVMNINTRDSLKSMIQSIRNEQYKTFPAEFLTWKIIESSDQEVIYEWTLSKKQDEYFPQTEICKAFFTKNGFHRIGITFKNPKINSQQRSEALSLLRDSRVTPMEETREGDHFSILEKIRSSLDLESQFSDWSVRKKSEDANGNSYMVIIPPTQTESYITEMIEISTQPKFKDASINTIFEEEKALLEIRFENDKIALEKHFDEKIKFEVIKKGKSEIIYTYTYPFHKFRLSAVVRTFLTDKGYYSIAYRKGQEHYMNKEDVQKWMKNLKQIKVQSL